MTDPLEDELIAFLYRWHRTESPGGFDIIDLDLLQESVKYPGAFADRPETTAAITALVAKIDGATDPQVANKLIACHTYLRALEGEAFSLSDYLAGTLGVRPVFIDEEFLRRQFDHNTELLDGLGYPHTQAGVSALKKDNALSIDEVRKAFADAETSLLPTLKTELGLTMEIDYRTEIVDEQAYWFNWTGTGDRGEVVLRFNTNERHEWLRGRPDALSLHEIGGHTLQILAWKSRIQQGLLPRSAGLITVFSPDVYLMEGLAETLAYFYPELPLSEYGRWTINQMYLDDLVWNNAHIMANDGATESDITQYVESRAPAYSTAEDIATRYTEMTQHPLLRAYLYSYGIGAYHHRLLADGLSAEDRHGYLEQAYSRPMTPDDIARWLARVGQA